MTTNVEDDQRRAWIYYEGALIPPPPREEWGKDSPRECTLDFHSITTCGCALAVQISAAEYHPVECHMSSCMNGRRSMLWVMDPLLLVLDKGSVRPLTRNSWQ